MAFPVYDGGQRFINEVGQKLRQIYEGICALNKKGISTYSTEVLTSLVALAATPSNTKKISLFNTSATAYLTVTSNKGILTLAPQKELIIEVNVADSAIILTSIVLDAGVLDKVIINYTRTTLS
jgi:hypothetical protein